MKITIGRNVTTSKVKHKDPHKLVKQLNVLANPAGDFSVELEWRQKYSTSMASHIRTLHMKQKKAFCLYRNIWLPACQYPLAVTMFSKEACSSVMKPFVCAILPKLGFNCNSPREIIYGSMKYGGFQFAYLYLEQGYLTLKHLIGHIREESIVGLQLMIALSFAQVVSGSRFAYLKEVKANRFHPGDATLEKLNLVRLYLGVVTLADLTNDAGTEIKPWVLTGERRVCPTIEWPNQEKPADSCFITWHQFLKKHFCTNAKRTHCLNKPLCLSTPLGSWLTDTPYSTRSFYYCPSSHSIIHYVNGSFSEYTRAPGQSTLYRLCSLIDSIPDTPVKKSASKLGPFLSSNAAADYVIDHPSLSETRPSAFPDYIQKLPEHVKQFLGNLHYQQINVD
eukprot:15366049-Ditylum_brightwellii.AAC.1